MCCLTSKIPIKYALNKVRLSLSEVLWACKNKLIRESDVVEYANIILSPQSTCLILEIAGLVLCNAEDYARFSEIIWERSIEDFYESMPLESQHSTHDKWLYIVLSFLHDYRLECDDFLERIEEIYYVFGYPQQIEKLSSLYSVPPTINISLLRKKMFGLFIEKAVSLKDATCTSKARKSSYKELIVYRLGVYLKEERKKYRYFRVKCR